MESAESGFAERDAMRAIPPQSDLGAGCQCRQLAFSNPHEFKASPVVMY
jgi:hypothetical protein